VQESFVFVLAVDGWKKYKKTPVAVVLAAVFCKILHLYFHFKNRNTEMNSDLNVAAMYIQCNCIPHWIGSHDFYNYTIMKTAYP